mgnify:CR=1 FL=1
MIASFLRRIALLFLAVAPFPIYLWLDQQFFISYKYEEMDTLLIYFTGPVVMSAYLAFLVWRSAWPAKIVAGLLALSMLLPWWIYRLWLEHILDARCEAEASVKWVTDGGYVHGGDQWLVLGCELGDMFAVLIAIMVAYVLSIIFALTIIIYETIRAEVLRKSRAL